MTDNTGPAPTNVRWEDPDGSWWIIDVFSRMVVGWQASMSLRSDLAIDALEMAIHNRGRTDSLEGVRHLHGPAGEAARLVGRRGCQPGGDGGDRDLLEAGVACP